MLKNIGHYNNTLRICILKIHFLSASRPTRNSLYIKDKNYICSSAQNFKCLFTGYVYAGSLCSVRNVFQEMVIYIKMMYVGYHSILGCTF